MIKLTAAACCGYTVRTTRKSLDDPRWYLESSCRPAVSHGRVSLRANFCFTRVGGSQYSRCERSGRASGPGLGRGV
jgi:hypothetical protein